MRFFCSFLLLTSLLVFPLAAVEPGGEISIAAIKEKAEPVAEQSAPARSKDAGTPYEVLMFYDATSRDAADSLAILEDMRLRHLALPEQDRADILALSRNSKRLTKASIGPGGIGIGVYADERRLLFNEYAAADLLLPFALIAKDGKVLWKGSVIDIENVLSLMRNKKFDPSLQVKIERIRREMQMAIQASLPDVILRCADDILKLQSGDAMAVRAKLFVLESTNRFSQALAFAKKNAEDNPQDVNQTLLYFEYLVKAGNFKAFQTAFPEALTRFQKDPESLFRLLNYAVAALPFAWFRPADTLPCLRKIRPYWTAQAPERAASFHETAARLLYLLCDPAGAAKEQAAALELCRGTVREADARRRLEYYQQIRTAK